MSISKWRYTEECNGRPCPGDCDHCSFEPVDLISRADAIEAVMAEGRKVYTSEYANAERIIYEADAVEALAMLPSAEAVHKQDYSYEADMVRRLKEELSADAEWIPCSERLPKINQRVLLATNEERVFVGYKEKPDIVWRVTEADGREHWVYDPENYTDDIDVLPKDEDCGFAKDDVYADGFLSVTSINYDDRFEGVIAWMPLPEPYREDDEV